MIFRQTERHEIVFSKSYITVYLISDKKSKKKKTKKLFNTNKQQGHSGFQSNRFYGNVLLIKFEM